MKKYLAAFACIFFACAALPQSLKDQLADGQVMLCAHRGGMYPQLSENSLETLKRLEEKSGGRPLMAEVDIRKSKDGSLYLMHDETLERTTNGKGTLASQSDAYLKSLKLKTGAGTVTQEPIPTFDQLLKFIQTHNIYLMLDVKIDDWQLILDKVKKANVVDRCLVLTFKPENSLKVYSILPEIAVSCLVTKEEDLVPLRPIMAGNNMYAYVNRDAPTQLMDRLRAQRIPLVSDASEATTHNGVPYDRGFYKGLFQRGIVVLVTDLPNEVGEFLK